MYDFILSNKERISIFKVLCEQKKINFNSIAKLTNIRSNKLSYQLNLMKEKNFISTNELGLYSLTIQAEKLIPYFSQIFKKEVGVLPVILGIVRNKNKILLIKRKKMPYKDHWGIFGGKQICGETIPETIIREVKEESRVDVEFKKYNGIIYERVKEDNNYKHSMLLILTTVEAKSDNACEQLEGEVRWFDYDDVLKNKIDNLIPSDLIFLNKYANKEINIEHITMIEENENYKIINE
jgi:8-oxo-dGTP diphosphatase